MYTCPQNHPSDTPDFCSVCGVEIPGGPAPPLGGAGGSGEPCPECGTPRASSGHVFCEVCGYNYQTRSSGVPLPAPPARPPAAVAQQPAGGTTREAPPPAEPANVRWDVLVTADPCLYGTPNPAAPVGQPEQTFTLFENENIIGRGGTGVRVQIPVHNDVGVSRRQALLTVQPDGSLVVRDVGSANGTQLNGVELLAGVDTRVKDGDTIAIGAWTRITVRAIRR